MCIFYQAGDSCRNKKRKTATMGPDEVRWLRFLMCLFRLVSGDDLAGVESMIITSRIFELLELR